MSASGFRPGLALTQAFYTDVVAPLVVFRTPRACSARVPRSLVFDSARSTDHEWGPRVQLFVAADCVDHVRRMAVANGEPVAPDRNHRASTRPHSGSRRPARRAPPHSQALPAHHADGLP